ncbi:MAG: ABC transporter permease [Candidatus Aminicenantes bacterium]|nr:MAG: ABC transporter permease [Candidatus Aminicenantes bacterium]
MFKSYFKLAVRNLFRHKLSSFINIVGLAVAIGCSIVFYILLDKEYSSDRFHDNVQKNFMITYTLEGDEEARRWGDSPLPLGPVLATDFPQIKSCVRIADQNAKVTYRDRVFGETIRFADPNFLEVFTFPLKKGQRTALSDKNALVLNEDMAIKYFGDEDPIGKELLLLLGPSQQDIFVVKGVAKKFPHNASFSFGILASLEKWEDLLAKDKNDWTERITATFIQVTDPQDMTVLASQLSRYNDRHNASNIDRPVASFSFEPLATLSWESQEIERSISSGSTPQALILLFTIGLFLLLQACFNYVNIALASGTRRHKEIGIRKVIGCHKRQLVCQFLGENLLLCLMALFVGLILTEFLLLPGLMEIMGNTEKLTLVDLIGNWRLWMFFVILLLFTGFGAGAYPALVISRLQPVSIISDKIKISGKKRFTGVLLSVQFGIAFIIICMVVTFLQNNRYQMKRDWGYDKEHVINIRLEKGEQFGILRNSAIRNPDVIKIAGSANAVGRSGEQAVIEFEAKKYEALRLDTGIDYLQTLGIRLKEGRLFHPDLLTDKDSSILVNERFMNEMGWQYGPGHVVRYENNLYNVIGVVEDFHHEFFFEEIKPIFFRLVPEDDYRFLSIRVKSGSGIRSAATLQETWHLLFPDSEYSSFFQDSVFDRGHQNNMTITKIFTATAIITLIISCMGLFGLVTLMISRRMKELSIHKVLGASSFQIANLIARRFILLTMVSIFLGLPLSYFLLQFMLDGIYRYHMSLGAIPFVLATLVVLAAAVSTIATQVYKASVRDPIDAIRYE